MQVCGGTPKKQHPSAYFSEMIDLIKHHRIQIQMQGENKFASNCILFKLGSSTVHHHHYKQEWYKKMTLVRNICFGVHHFSKEARH